MLEDTAALKSDMREMKHRMSTVEAQIGSMLSSEQSHYATVMTRLDQTEMRLERIERRLDLLPPAA
ncbi:MAG TPA: hypothetical protein VJY39_00595 [Acidisphaera sp.]|nr:hypothetical protein [Acidisphaera sp.]